MSRRRRHPYPVTAAVLAGAAIVFLWVLAHAALVLLPVLLLGVAARLGWRNRHAIARAWHRPNGRPRIVQGTVLRPDPELGQLRADLAETQRRLFAIQAQAAREVDLRDDLIRDLRHQLAAAQDAAHAAWDQAATVQPRPAAVSEEARERLLSAPMAGVRPLTGGDR